jgi:hypothetical protein
MPNYPMRALGHDVFESNGTLYVPFSNVRLSCGAVLPSAEFLVVKHLIVPPDLKIGLRDNFVGGTRTVWPNLVAAETVGDSMIDRKIYSGNIVLFTQSELGDVRENHIVVVEKQEAENFGAWTLKIVVMKSIPFVPQDQFEDESYWNGPILELRPANPSMSPILIDPQGRYRLHGFYKRVMPSHDAQFEDSEHIRYLAAKK